MIKINLDNETRSKIKEYYKTSVIFCPTDMKWRFFKFRLGDGTFVQVTARNKDQLRKLLIRYCPVDVYYSSSKFMNPGKIKGQQTKKEDIIFLGNDLVFDIDAPYREGIMTTKKILNKFGEPSYILRTSKEGIQVVYEYHDPPLSLCAVEKKREDTVKDIEGIDKPITTDMFRVIRLPLTIHRKGNICQLLMGAGKDSLNYVFTKNIIMPRSRNAMTGEVSPLQNTGNKSRVGIRDVAYAYYLSNNVIGTKGQYVPLLVYNIGDVNYAEIRKIMRTYEIPCFYIFIDDDYIYFLSLITVSEERLRKILNASTAKKAEFIKYKQIFMKITPESDKPDNELRFLGCELNINPNRKYLLSKSHLLFLLSRKIEIKERGYFLGEPELKITKTWKS